MLFILNTRLFVYCSKTPNSFNIENKKKVKVLLARIFSRMLYKTNLGTKKATKKQHGLDLLKVERQKELLSISILRVEEVYTKILEQGNPKEFMQKQGKKIFLQCIKKSCEDFLTKQYGCKVKVNTKTLKKSLYTKNILQATELLFQVPFYIILDENSRAFQLIYYPVYTSASENLIEALIDNLILEISNCVMYFSIIKFSSVYSFRKILYRSNFLSLRNFERFKNNFSWQLVTKIYLRHPTDLYNNKYNISILRTSGIYSKSIYANRSKEISNMRGFTLLPLMFLELADFVSSRVEETLYFISTSVRFILTSVFGQIIGLIWRGVLDGLK